MRFYLSRHHCEMWYRGAMYQPQNVAVHMSVTVYYTPDTNRICPIFRKVDVPLHITVFVIRIFYTPCINA